MSTRFRPNGRKQPSFDRIVQIRLRRIEVRWPQFVGALEYAANMNPLTRMADDFKKGLQAFLKKERVSW